MSVPFSGHQYEISAGALRAVVTEAGAGLRELWAGERPLLDRYDADEPCPGAHGQLLIPWPNRVDHGRYSFAGRSHQLDITEVPRDTAIHGLTRWASWRLAEHEPHRVRLTHRLHGQPGYPFVLDLDVTYALDARDGLTTVVSATNVGSRPAPYGNGAHPYLTVGLPRIDDCAVTVSGASWLPTDERGIPTGTESVVGTPYDLRKPRRLGDLAIDYAYTDLERDADGRAWARLEAPDGSATVSLWVDDTYRWLEIFTGDGLDQLERRRTGLGVEPMSCPPNALVTGEGVITLQPGATTTGTWGITCATR